MEDKEVDLYAWTEGKEIVADVLTKQGWNRDGIDKIMIRSFFRNVINQKNCVK